MILGNMMLIGVLSTQAGVYAKEDGGEGAEVHRRSEGRDEELQRGPRASKGSPKKRASGFE